MTEPVVSRTERRFEVIATVLLAMFRDEFEPAFEAWTALDPLNNRDAPPSPLAMPEYQLAVEQQAIELDSEAEATFQEGEDANAYSDVYTLATLLFASVLFFAAISERFDLVPARVTLLVLAGVGLIGGVVTVASSPSPRADQPRSREWGWMPERHLTGR